MWAEDKFLDYVDTEGIVQPILTIKLNVMEAGMVRQIVAEEGAMLNQGDTVLVLKNPDLERVIEEQQDEWEKQRVLYEEKKVEMEQKIDPSTSANFASPLRVEPIGERFRVGTGRVRHGREK
jgi:multidrug efflux pump subunit AcrA (membrane-fusion protein)